MYRYITQGRTKQPPTWGTEMQLKPRGAWL